MDPMIAIHVGIQCHDEGVLMLMMMMMRKTLFQRMLLRWCDYCDEEKV
jgi:hypothetical protein